MNVLSHACIQLSSSIAERAVVVCACCRPCPVAAAAPLLLLSMLLSSAALSAAAEVGKDQKSGDPAPKNTKAQDAATLDNKSVKPNSGNNSNSSNSISTGSSSSSEGIDTTSSSKDNTMPAKPGQIVRPKAPGMNDIGPDGKYRFPLDLKLSVKREGLKAVGTATIINTLKDIVEVRGSQIVGVGVSQIVAFASVRWASLGQQLSAAEPTARGSQACLQVKSF